MLGIKLHFSIISSILKKKKGYFKLIFFVEKMYGRKSSVAT